jgi:hypothetical protein
MINMQQIVPEKWEKVLLSAWILAWDKCTNPDIVGAVEVKMLSAHYFVVHTTW